MENINLIRSIAWSFHRTTGVDYQELFSEASVAYCEAVNLYSSKRNCKLTSFAFTIMQNKLRLFCASEKKHQITDFPSDYDATYHQAPPFEEIIEDWPEDCQHLARMLLKNPAWFTARTPNFERRRVAPKSVRGRIKKYLRDQGWEEGRINITIQNIITLI